MEYEIYLEVIKKVSAEEELVGIPQGFTQKVSSKDEAIELYNKLKELGVFNGLKPYIARVHIHRHTASGENQPCQVETIEEVE